MVEGKRQNNSEPPSQAYKKSGTTPNPRATSHDKSEEPRQSPVPRAWSNTVDGGRAIVGWILASVGIARPYQPRRLAALESKKYAPRPRDATSVAIRMGERPALNSPRTQSRSRLHDSQRKPATRKRGKNELFLVTVNGQGRPALLTKVFGNLIGNTFCANEDENFCVLGADLVQVLLHLTTLLKVAYDFDNLRDVVVGSELHGTNVALDHVCQEIL